MKIFNAKEIRDTERVVFAEDAIKEIQSIRQNERERIKNIILKHFDGKIHVSSDVSIDLIEEIEKETHTQQEKYKQSLDNKGLPTTEENVQSNAVSKDGKSPVENSSLTAQEIVDYITKDIEKKRREQER